MARPLEAPLVDPFIIASGRLDHVENVAVGVVLDDGAEGWGEIACLRPVTTEDAPTARRGVHQVARRLIGLDVDDVPEVLEGLLPGLTATGAGIEMAVLDAVARARQQPLHRLFGSAGARVSTDITIPITLPARASELAVHWRSRGFDVLKCKVGRGVDEDLCFLAAVRAGHPEARLVLDANEGWTADEALRVLEALRSAGIEPALLEQPVRREDWSGLGRLAREAGVPVAADESCRSLGDARRIVEGGLAQVVNIKLSKLGVRVAEQVVGLAKTSGIGLMIGGMVETRIGMGFAAHFVSGLGGFDWIDLDTPLLLARDPIVGGTLLRGSDWDVSGVAAGHGGQPSGERRS